VIPIFVATSVRNEASGAAVKVRKKEDGRNAIEEYLL
jgi:hypothetical protein